MDVSKNMGTQHKWFIMEILIKIDDFGVPLFLETPISIHHFVDVFSTGKGVFPARNGSLLLEGEC